MLAVVGVERNRRYSRITSRMAIRATRPTSRRRRPGSPRSRYAPRHLAGPTGPPRPRWPGSAYVCRGGRPWTTGTSSPIAARRTAGPSGVVVVGVERARRVRGVESRAELVALGLVTGARACCDRARRWAARWLTDQALEPGSGAPAARSARTGWSRSSTPRGDPVPARVSTCSWNAAWTPSGCPHVEPERRLSVGPGRDHLLVAGPSAGHCVRISSPIASDPDTSRGTAASPRPRPPASSSTIRVTS